MGHRRRSSRTVPLFLQSCDGEGWQCARAIVRRVPGEGILAVARVNRTELAPRGQIERFRTQAGHCGPRLSR